MRRTGFVLKWKTFDCLAGQDCLVRQEMFVRICGVGLEWQQDLANEWVGNGHS